jgi:hypothetical protein
MAGHDKDRDFRAQTGKAGNSSSAPQGFVIWVGCYDNEFLWRHHEQADIVSGIRQDCQPYLRRLALRILHRVERVQIFTHRPRVELGPVDGLITVNAFVAAGVASTTLASTAKPSLPTNPAAMQARTTLFEHVTEDVALAETPMPVLGNVEWSGTSSSRPSRQNHR